MYSYYPFYDGFYSETDPYLESALKECKDEEERNNVRIAYIITVIISFIGTPIVLGVMYSVYKLIF